MYNEPPAGTHHLPKDLGEIMSTKLVRSAQEIRNDLLPTKIKLSHLLESVFGFRGKRRHSVHFRVEFRDSLLNTVMKITSIVYYVWKVKAREFPLAVTNWRITNEDLRFNDIFRYQSAFGVQAHEITVCLNNSTKKILSAHFRSVNPRLAPLRLTVHTYMTTIDVYDRMLCSTKVPKALEALKSHTSDKYGYWCCLPVTKLFKKADDDFGAFAGVGNRKSKLFRPTTQAIGLLQADLNCFKLDKGKSVVHRKLSPSKRHATSRSITSPPSTPDGPIRKFNIRKQATIPDLTRKGKIVLFQYIRHRRRNKPTTIFLKGRNLEPTNDQIAVSEVYRETPCVFLVRSNKGKSESTRYSPLSNALNQSFTLLPHSASFPNIMKFSKSDCSEKLLPGVRRHKIRQLSRRAVDALSKPCTTKKSTSNNNIMPNRPSPGAISRVAYIQQGGMQDNKLLSLSHWTHLVLVYAVYQKQDASTVVELTVPSVSTRFRLRTSEFRGSVYGDLSDSFCTESGGHEGCTAYLFNFVVDEVMRRTLQGHRNPAVQATADGNVVHLKYADDIVPFFEEYKAQMLLDELTKVISPLCGLFCCMAVRIDLFEQRNNRCFGTTAHVGWCRGIRDEATRNRVFGCATDGPNRVNATLIVIETNLLSQVQKFTLLANYE
ncbi:hypothetical protein CLF_100915 [Clonorchis sinensis]|uniref:Uncharacterized protein n=1 Tax=Clonorchis sinensis TaxID=79923 RepID=G7Y4J1_CLOSI|nr:hypothetical protein CLF_100915 [Clonorchis sinensis]